MGLKQVQEPHNRRMQRGKRRRIISIRLIVTLATVVLLSGSILGVGMVTERNTRTTLQNELQVRLTMLAGNLSQLSSSALLSDFPELTLHPLVKELESRHPELAFVVVIDHEHRVQGHSDVRSLGSTYELPSDLTPMPGTEDLPNGSKMLENSEILVAVDNVKHPNGETIGQALVGLHRSYIDKMVTRARQKALLITSVLLVVGVVLALVLMSVLLRPLTAIRAGLERIGRGDLDTPLRVRDRTEFGLLAESMNEMAKALKAAQSEMVEKERLAHEMDLAKEIQGSLLPSSKVETDGFTILGANHAAAEVGGDYVDILRLADGRVGLAIADVAGKGLVGCLVMSMLAALLRSMKDAYDSPAQLLVALDRQLRDSLRPGVFVTMFYGILDPRRNRVICASAAHSPLLHYVARERKAHWHYSKAIPLGVVRSGDLFASTLEEQVVDLGAGDLLFQFTDGVNEAWEPTGAEEFGFDRIREVVERHASRGAAAVVKEVRDRLQVWMGGKPRFDDETILVVHREASTAVSDTTPRQTPGVLGGQDLGQLWALRRGAPHLAFAADLEKLGAIKTWLHQCPDLRGLTEMEFGILEYGLYELCANIVEHGYGGDSQKIVDVWWISNVEEVFGDSGADPSGTSFLERVRTGAFLVRDYGTPFNPTERTSTSLDDPATRKRGRGLGLAIIREAMSGVCYAAASRYGNITVMQFNPLKHRKAKEDSNEPRTKERNLIR